MSSSEDVNGDDLLDLVVHVETETLELSETDTEAVLEGETYDGTRIRGVDTVRVVPPAAPSLSTSFHRQTGLLPAFPGPGNPEVWIPGFFKKEDFSGEDNLTLFCGQTSPVYVKRSEKYH
jgi:hypothetical protein